MKNRTKLKKGEVKRVFLVVLDSCGIGEAPDAQVFGSSPVE